MFKAVAGLSRLLVYRNILQDELIKKLPQTSWEDCDPDARAELAAGLIAKAEELGLSGNVLAEYLLYLVSEDENIFSIMAEKTGGKIGESLYQAAVQDLEIIRDCVQMEGKYLPSYSLLAAYQPTRSSEKPGFSRLRTAFFAAEGEDDTKKKAKIENTCTSRQLVAELINYYVCHGYGQLAKSAAFRWEREAGLVAIHDYDRIKMTDIIGYEVQKEALSRNTEAFVNGCAANHVLLAGARGTGKSSCVKAIVNQYFTQGLRLVEVPKQELKNLSAIMDVLRERGKRFILFLDDLSFEEYELEYKILKSVLEGGAQSRPANVIVYATSNRRHLVKESWSDREGGEIHQQDAVNEKISLSDRFGLTLTFTSPSQDEYLKIVTELAKRQQIELPVNELQAQALRWEMSHSGRSGRVARQFIIHLAGKKKIK